MQPMTIRIPVPNYPAEDHQTWHSLCTIQMDLTRNTACRAFHEGFPKLDLDFNRIPDPNMIGDRLERMTGWRLVNAENAFLDARHWFNHLAQRRFPVTNYIRRPEELHFCELPDLFHEYFGHLSLFTDPEVADIAQRFGQIGLKIRDEERELKLARIWWFIFEVGFIREDDSLRVIGGALLSSPGELEHSFKPETPKLPFVIEQVTQTQGMYYTYHDHYFYIESIDHIHSLLDDFVRQEGL
jgi:phenylalanine-4-hydroxylase